jgi:hypothetical protein
MSGREIVPYGNVVTPYNKRLRTGDITPYIRVARELAFGQYSEAAQDLAKLAAQGIQGAYRRYRSRRSQNTDMSFTFNAESRTLPHHTASRTDTVQQVFTNADDCVAQTMYFKQFTWPVADSTLVNSKIARETDDVFLKGIKLDRTFRAFARAQGPIEIHYFILQAKDNDTTFGLVSDSIRRGFFRSHNEDTDEERDFVDEAAAYSRSFGSCLKNQDADWKTVYAKKFTLRQKSNQVQIKCDKMILRDYIKINKLMHFQKSTDTLPMNTFIECYYANWLISKDFQVGNSFETEGSPILYLNSTAAQVKMEIDALRKRITVKNPYTDPKNPANKYKKRRTMVGWNMTRPPVGPVYNTSYYKK